MSKTNTSLFILFFSILVIFFVFIPVIGYFVEKREILAHTNERLKTLESNEMKLQEIQLKISEKESSFNKLDSALSSGPMTPSTIRFLQRLISENGLSLVSIGTFSTVSSSIKSQINETQISFSTKGSYESLKNFLKSLEDSAKIFEVESVSISPVFTSSEKEEGEGAQITSFDFGITVKTFSY